MVKDFEWTRTPGWSVFFDGANGDLGVTNVGETSWLILTPKAATDLASSLLQWSSQNRQPIDEEGVE